MKWHESQIDIATCRECVSRWKGLVVDPLEVGEIPDPPAKINILFVGVAPTRREGKNKGSHFYSCVGDNLRRGLFRLLSSHFEIALTDVSCEEGNRVFHAHGFFFIHAGKVRPVAQDAPPEEPLIYCANRHLRDEIEILQPKAICFLGLNNLVTVTRSLFGRQVSETPLRASIDEWTGWVALAPQPVRGSEKRTRLVIEKLWKLVM